MKKILVALFLLFSSLCFSQQPDNKKAEAWKTVYRATSTKINDLIHTKLGVSFDFSKSWMYGKVQITLKPHFYPTDSLNLDAKRMEIKEVSVIKDGKHIPLKYTYDSLKLHINLDKTYRGGRKLYCFY
ncbi:MAG: hypothetical protein NTZ85_08975 [Bacteroidia bacterium]|nr:hypothetical protein [Bacteroidia bacterium]